MPGRVSLIKSPRFTRCEARKIKLLNGYKPPLMIGTPGCLGYWWTRYYAACATMLDTRTCSPKSVYPHHHERKVFVLRRAKAAERLQGCGRLHSRRMGSRSRHRAGVARFRYSNLANSIACRAHH